MAAALLRRLGSSASYSVCYRSWRILMKINVNELSQLVELSIHDPI